MYRLVHLFELYILLQKIKYLNSYFFMQRHSLFHSSDVEFKYNELLLIHCLVCILYDFNSQQTHILLLMAIMIFNLCQKFKLSF